ncbi:putative pentatricopeptide repeat-containing protein [Nymphaea thermarum]|nr:putative pentatricopeptide repeat-containing protein [Nymphaea thermarum]
MVSASVRRLIANFHPKCKIYTCPHSNSDIQRQSVAWNKRIASYVNAGDHFDVLLLFARIQDSGVLPTPFTFSSVLHACSVLGSIGFGIQIHSAIVKLGFDSDVFCGSALVSMYCKCCRVDDGHQVFAEMPERNTVTWNALISGYAQIPEFSHVAVYLFLQMLESGVVVSSFTLTSVLVACSRTEARELGRLIHGYCLKFGVLDNVVMGTALVDMYVKCSRLVDARRVVDEMPEKNVVTWTSLVTGYAQNGLSEEVLMTIREMLRVGVRPNQLTYSSALSSYTTAGGLPHGRQVHCQVIRAGIESAAYITATLITMYSKCGSSEDFWKLCSGISVRDRVAWNSVIAGHACLGDDKEVLKNFSIMMKEFVSPDVFTFASVLRAVGNSAALEQGKQTHVLVFKTGYASNLYVQNGLVSMYGKCGLLEDSERVFYMMRETDLISWNSLMAGYAQHGHGRKAVELFEQMRHLGIRPDDTTFLCVLSACSHSGLHDKGLEYFDLMSSEQVVPKAEHYSCVVDLLGRAGYLDEAESFMNSMPVKPGLSMFRSLISACQAYGYKNMAIRVAKHFLELYPADSSTYVLLSNMLAGKGSWGTAAVVRKLMNDRGLIKKPGYSWIEAGK